MRKIRQVLRLKYEAQLSIRKIALSLNISRDAVKDYLTRACAANLTWPLPETLDDDVLELRLFPVSKKARISHRPRPVYEQVYEEMKKPGATLWELHGNYLAQHPDGICYSQFNYGYIEFKKRLKPSMRQTYRAGECVFVDYAGQTKANCFIAGIDRPVEIFVAVLGASNYIYSEAHWSQKLPDWIAAHVRMFEYFGGVTAAVVCDNLKSGVTKASRKEPVINAVYQNFADHYHTAIIPTRPRKPKDKAKVENAVLIVQLWILFRLWDMKFANLGELNSAIKALLVEANNRAFKKLPGSRQSAFEHIDLPALKPLPKTPFVYAEFRRVRVSMDYYINIDGYLYTVPAELRHCKVDLRITANTVEVLYKGRRVASHVRNPAQRVTINPEHMTEEHRQFGCWNPGLTLNWAEQLGSSVLTFTEGLFKSARTHTQGYRFNLTLRELLNQYGVERLNQACLQVLEISNDKITSHSLNSLRSVLKNGLDRQRLQEAEYSEADFEHANIRGASYYY